MSHAFSRRRFLATVSLSGAGLVAGRMVLGAENDDPVAPWRQGVCITPVSKVHGRYTLCQDRE